MLWTRCWGLCDRDLGLCVGVCSLGNGDSVFGAVCWGLNTGNCVLMIVCFGGEITESEVAVSRGKGRGASVGVVIRWRVGVGWWVGVRWEV